MARAIKFLKDYGQVKLKGKKPTGGFKKGQVWPHCSAQHAQKLVNHLGVAEFVEEKAGDHLKSKAKASADAAKKVLDDAKAEATRIKEEAEKKAAETIKAAEDLANGDDMK